MGDDMSSGRIEQALDGYEQRFGGLPCPSPCSYAPSYCRECDEMVLLVIGGGDEITCPVCGRRPGALELGTESPEAWHEMDEEVKPDA